jgi:hypothetical protein
VVSTEHVKLYKCLYACVICNKVLAFFSEMHAYFQVSSLLPRCTFSAPTSLFAKPNLQALDKSHHLGFEWRCGRRGGGGVIGLGNWGPRGQERWPSQGEGVRGRGEGERGERDVIMATNLLNFWYRI